MELFAVHLWARLNLGKAPAGAIMLETMICGGKVEVPEALLKTYPKELQPYARP